MSSFFSSVLLIFVVAVGVVLVWVWFSGFSSRALGSVEMGGELLKIEGGNLTSTGLYVRVFLWVRNLGGSTSFPRTIYVLTEGGSVVCVADGLPWVIRPGELLYWDVWMPVGRYEEPSRGMRVGCEVGVARGGVYVVKLVTARGAEFTTVLTAS